MMSYINETDFVIENKELVYPEIITDGLQLYYDAKGKRDTDYHRDTMLDMSGNKNHGHLQNFAYEKHSGYKDGLVFDYIDDKLVRPRLNLKPDDFTFMLNGNIISFSPDGTVKRVQDGEVIESKGFNMIRDGNFFNKTKWWQLSNLKLISKENGIGKFEITSSETAFIHQAINGDNFSENDLIYTSLESHIPHSATVKYIRWFDYKNIVLTGSSSDSLTRWSGIFRTGAPHPDYGATIRHHAQLSPGTRIELGRYIFVNLTRAFGAGNEPTKEQMDEIINRFGFIPNAQDLIDRIEYKGNDLGDMENIIDGLYKTEVLSGEEIYTDKADDDAVVHVEVDGKSVGGGSGKNMFNKYLLSDRSNFQLNVYSSSPVFQLKPNTVYVISAREVKASPNGYQLVLNVMNATNGAPLWRDSDYNSNILRAVFNTSGSGLSSLSQTFTTPDSGRISFSYFDAKNGQSPDGNWFTDVMIDAQLEEGSVATAYEPPAPTPDYPITIHNLNDFDVVSGVGKRNLLVGRENGNTILNANNGTTSPIIYKSYEDYDSVTLIGGHQLSTYATEFTTFILEKDKEYTASMYVYSPVKLDLSIKGYAGNIWTTVPANTWTRLSRTITGTGNKQRLPSLYSRNAEALNHEIFYNRIKLEEGKISSYSPAPEDITENDNHPFIDKINLLLDEPLRSVGDVKDRLFRDSDGVWKIERNVGEYIVTGLEAWGLNATWSDSEKNVFEVNAQDFISHNPLNPRFKKVTSNYFTGFNSSNPPINHFRIQENKYGNYFTISLSSTFIDSDSTAWRNWLKDSHSAGVPLIVLYEQDANTEILPQTLQDKLNNLRSFEDSNYVYTVLPNEDNYISDNLKPTLHAKFLYNNWYKEDRVINNLMIYNRALTNEEMLQNYKTIKRRWGM